MLVISKRTFASKLKVAAVIFDSRDAAFIKASYDQLKNSHTGGQVSASRLPNIIPLNFTP